MVKLSKELDTLSGLRLWFWSRLFVKSAKAKAYLHIPFPRWWFNFCERGVWKQLNKIPK